jgi:hypothetical protein
MHFTIYAWLLDEATDIAQDRRSALTIPQSALTRALLRISAGGENDRDLQ